MDLPPAAKNEEIPTLARLGPSSKEQLVNYRLDDARLIVDKPIHRAYVGWAQSPPDVHIHPSRSD